MFLYHVWDCFWIRLSMFLEVILGCLCRGVSFWSWISRRIRTSFFSFISILKYPSLYDHFQTLLRINNLCLFIYLFLQICYLWNDLSISKPKTSILHFNSMLGCWWNFLGSMSHLRRCRHLILGLFRVRSVLCSGRHSACTCCQIHEVSFTLLNDDYLIKLALVCIIFVLYACIFDPLQQLTKKIYLNRYLL